MKLARGLKTLTWGWIVGMRVIDKDSNGHDFKAMYLYGFGHVWIAMLINFQLLSKNVILFYLHKIIKTQNFNTNDLKLKTTCKFYCYISFKSRKIKTLFC